VLRAARAIRILVVVIALAGVAAGGTFTVIRVRSETNDRERTNVARSARIAAAAVNDRLTRDMAALTQTTGSPGFRRAVLRRDWGAAGPYVSELHITQRDFASVSLYDSRGFLVVRFPSDHSVLGRRFSTQGYFRNVRTSFGIFISKIFVGLGVPKVAVIAYSTSIHVGNGFRGALVLTRPIASFDSLLAPFTDDGITIHVYDAPAERIAPSSPPSAASHADDPSVASALAGFSRVRRTTTTLEASAPVPAGRWGVVASKPAQLVDDRVHDVTIRYGAIAGVVFALALVAVIATASSARGSVPNE